MSTRTITGHDLTLADLARFEQERSHMALDGNARERVAAGAAEVGKVVDTKRVCYGINTGFGAFARRRISPDRLVQLQYNLVRSHSCGVGEPLPAAVTRRLMLLKANSLAVGHSGVRPVVIDTLLALLNKDIVPVIPSRGSVGASGDLAPLAHLSLALIGEGEAVHQGHHLEGAEVLEAAGCRPIELAAKEGLALLNGTQVSAALAMEGLFAAHNALLSSIVIGALTLEALAGSYQPFDARIHMARRLRGQIKIAEQFRTLLTGSEIWKSHQGCDRVQDPYALRCMPQVFGAVWDTLAHAADVLSLECNSVSDNPLIFDDDVISGGNFHAAPLGFIADFLAFAAAELGSISERRTDLLMKSVNPRLNMFLTNEPGLESGMMMAHVTAAALVSENKTLAHPASIDSIPTSAGQEDHVSMATWAGLKLVSISANIDRILAIEAIAAARAIDMQRPLGTTAELERVHAQVREAIPEVHGDKRADGDIASLATAVRSGLLAHLLPKHAEAALF